ncbi:UvrD-helicase domain-containing protein [Sphaerisporangium corydalis]|uniref:DNA 3'-5' helicase n=1 Tax=Sphaerisporangium corydalis TaxID=1441875 RepID=A0ABV9EHW2_9ACTN|nr:UvrD-helicase domain-containing protein [Sphaerisporangium corydalis]
MNGPYDGDPRLTPEQQKVVRLPVDARTLVIAEAGAGKTHTLVRRLDALMTRDEVNAGEVLVLSFSRAAVRELKERLARHGDTARHVRVQTFDSWALELLLVTDADGDWLARGFDERIEAATDLIGDPDVDELYENLRHLVVDEVQDLVGSRRDLVETLLDTYDCGFTVVGDPAQAIYGFQVADPTTRAAENGRFFDWLRVRFEDELVELRLTKNFRAQTEEAMTVLSFAPLLQAGVETSGELAYRDLRNALLGTLLMGDLEDEFVRQSLQQYEGTTAILCRTNGQALLVSERLHAGGVSHRRQRSARDRVAPAWLASLFRATDTSILTQTRFEEALQARPFAGGTDHARLWDLLLRTTRGRGQTVDLLRMRSVIAAGGLPDELTAQPPANLVVSSVHHAKGLEFDRVIVVDPGPLQNDGPRPIDAAEEARTLYVALSRPRQELMHLRPLQIAPLYLRKAFRLERWGLYRMGKKTWRHGLELIGRDVCSREPAGDHIQLPNVQFHHTALDLQELFVDKVRPGDEVILRRVDGEPSDIEKSPTYVVSLRNHGHPIGLTSDAFAADLYTYMRIRKEHRPTSWPATITGVSIDSVETVTGVVSAGATAGLGGHGVWLAPRLGGLGRFSYDKPAAAEEGDHG